MGILEKYMLVQWGKWFCLSSFFLLTILLLQLISESSDQFLSDDLSTIFSWLSLRCLAFIPWILPIACFSATLLTVSFLMIKGEMTGILSCSFSVIYCFRSIFILGFLISIVAWLSMIYYHDFKQRLAFESTELSQESHFQMKIDTKRLWYFSRFNLERKRGENVHLYAYDSQGNDSFRVRAQKAYWDAQNHWVFENGQFMGFASNEGLPIMDSNSQQIVWDTDSKRSSSDSGKISPSFCKKFDSLVFSSGMDDPEVPMLLSKRANILSFSELIKVIKTYSDTSSADIFPYRYRLYQLIWNSFGCLLSIFCGLMLVISNKNQKLGQIIGMSTVGILLFYAFRTVFDSLGENGILPASFCAGSPYLGILLISIFYYHFSNSKDSFWSAGKA
jgi:lipopolysaccharide export LptBFGC system permease protein LptF